ncbi:zinc finger and BTB domain-containing protein 34 [Amia ocellicauda]|uniref:zinc finger and BTB domain-containing protein 34 n=1 Tax=Amia ocellicauda TaxID=2972642 RepID=UPI00346484AF
MEPETNSFRVEFPDFSCSVLQKLNQQRQLGQLCDITVVVQGHRFRAHKAVLAASSPYFCDQVLLKNSTRVILPDVMHPGVFESLLQSCYSGMLLLPVGEVVGFLTAASFLQMWHVVDKCTELLEGNSAMLCQRSGPSSDHPSPGSSSYNSGSEGFDLVSAAQAELGKIPDYKDGQPEPQAEDGFSPQALEPDPAQDSSSPVRQDLFSTEMASQDEEDGDSDGAEYQYSKPLYIQPSIMYHKRWIQVKAERYEQEDYDALAATPITEEPQGSDSEQANPPEGKSQLGTVGCPYSGEALTAEKPAAELKGRPQGELSYDEQMDFYGASMEEFSSDRAEAAVNAHREDSGIAEPRCSGDEGAELASGIQEETSHSGFTAVVYKLYPCQCGKSFTHKSQRDRHMSMHLGLRPYGCGVCGKKFKMKHHLVGHMKIHTGIKPYECNICSKRFMWRDSFHRHVSSCTKAYQAKHAEQTAEICEEAWSYANCCWGKWATFDREKALKKKKKKKKVSIQEMDDSNNFIEFDVPEFSNTVLSQLNELRLQGKLCDIIVHIQGQPFRAHKAVLAASSPYFRDHSALSTMSGLSISVIKNPEVFEQLLAFCYTGHMSLQLKDVISFLTAASFLQMQAVIDKCTQILEGIHSKISLPGHPDAKDGSQASRNGVKDRNPFVNPLEISPPCFSRQALVSVGGAGDAKQDAGRGLTRHRLQEEGQSDRGSSGSVSEHETALEGEQEQVDLIGRDGQVTDIKVKLEKSDRPSCSDSSSAGDDGYHTEMIDGEQVLAVSVGSYGPVLQHTGYTYPPVVSQSSSSFVSLSNSSPSRSMLSSFRGGRARPKRPVPVPAEVPAVLKPAQEDGEAVLGSPGFENDLRERSMRGQWYPYNERLICIYCGKSFNQKGSLDRHMRLHMGITPFVCKFCGKKYTRKDQLEYHIRGHTDNKPFHCEICGKCFPFQGTLNQHLRKKHMGVTDVRNHMDSPDRAEGTLEPKDPDDPLAVEASMEYSTQYGEENPGQDEHDDIAKGSPEGAPPARCDF